jgi:hypothetical protein
MAGVAVATRPFSSGLPAIMDRLPMAYAHTYPTPGFTPNNPVILPLPPLVPCMPDREACRACNPGDDTGPQSGQAPGRRPRSAALAGAWALPLLRPAETERTPAPPARRRTQGTKPGREIPAFTPESGRESILLRLALQSLCPLVTAAVGSARDRGWTALARQGFRHRRLRVRPRYGTQNHDSEFP